MQTIQGDGFIVNIIKSKRRKTMALKVDTNGVSARIPMDLSLSTVQAFTEKKTKWIQKKLAEQQQQIVPEKQFIDGEHFLLLAQQYTLRFHPSDLPPEIQKTATEIILYGRQATLSKTAIRAAIIDWYRQQATDYLTARSQWLSEITGLTPTTITVKHYKARWGSCSSKDEINFNWQLIQAPVEVIDYIIIHELCHISQHNHSAEFWQLVARFMPDFKTHRQWLKDNGHTLTL